MPMLKSSARFRIPSRHDRARRSFGRRIARFFVWCGLLTAVTFVAYLAARPKVLTWGTTGDEATRALPGDELVPAPSVQATRAITIDATAEAIWPWLVQMGQGRGGLYSYEALENLLNCDIRNADRIIPELQSLKVGDVIRLVPDPYVPPWGGTPTRNGPRYQVASLETGRALVLRVPAEAEAKTSKYDGTWAFVLQPIDSKSTRLVIRSRAFADPPWAAPLIGVEPLHFVMERRMLLGIKERAEGLGSSQPRT